ncbi:MAG: hypothetical protein JSV24_02735, partial [Bacteroidales bacterium]
MERKVNLTFIVISMIILFSCDYETHVINTVHEDGSVTRKVIVINDTNREFESKNFRVPIDSTWNTEVTEELNDNNDTIWILTAEKHFASVDEINEEYIHDKGSNRALKRRANFSKRFKWFTTVFRYSETVGKVLTVTCPATDFMTDEELTYFYLPESVKSELATGKDSVRYEALSDSVETNSEIWLWTGLVRQWIETFYDLFGDHPQL